jgi:hypothetical protein
MKMNMKKTGQIAIFALFVGVVFSSCKKNYTCACNVKVEAYTEGDSTASITVEAQDTTVNYAYEGVSKKDANNKCDGSQTTLAAQYDEFFGDHASVNCEVN